MKRFLISTSILLTTLGTQALPVRADSLELRDSIYLIECQPGPRDEPCWHRDYRKLWEWLKENPVDPEPPFCPQCNTADFQERAIDIIPSSIVPDVQNLHNKF